MLAGSTFFTINHRIWMCSDNCGPEHHSSSIGKSHWLWGTPMVFHWFTQKWFSSGFNQFWSGKTPIVWVQHGQTSHRCQLPRSKHLQKSWRRLHGPRAADADPSCLTRQEGVGWCLTKPQLKDRHVIVIGLHVSMQAICENSVFNIL